MDNANLIAKIDRERLFGAGVDIYKNYYIVLGISNILNKIGSRTSSDSDWFRAVTEYVTYSELAELYDKIMPPKSREAQAQSHKYRTPPELTDDDPDDIVSFLNRNVVFRKKMWRGMAKIYQQRVKEYKAMLDDENHQKSATEIRFEEMRELFELTAKEQHAIMAVFLSQTRAVELGDFDINRFRSGEKITALAQILGTLDVEVAEMMNDNRNIRKYGLLDDDLDLDRTFLSYLSGISSKPLAERFWVKYQGETLPWEFHSQIAEKHGAVLKEMIKAKSPENGLSVLLYGVAGSGKTSFAGSLAADMGKTLYFIAQNDDDNRRMSYSPAFRYAALAVAQKQLDPEKTILALDEADKLVENTGIGGGFLSMIFGDDITGSRDGESKGQLNNVIDRNRHTVLWICNSKQNAIDPSSRRRFDYNILFDDLTASARQHVWRNALKFHHAEGSLSDLFITRVSSRYPVNPGGISLAVKNAAMICRANPEKDFEKEVMIFLKAHCQLLGIAENQEDHLEPARDYSLDGLNIKSGIKLPRLIEVCRNFLASAEDLTASRDRPRMNLLLFGPPGAGKTEFVKYLAKQLDMKLNIKNASNLLSCYHGVTEQRISQAFAEAEANNEILFVDEGDSMLNAREGAVRNFEVSQVNTMLAEMERFNGIFIVSTNMIQRMDQASLRRFSFRLHMDYLTDEGKEKFFATYFTKPMELPELTDDECRMLHSIDKLTPSDFRNTRQQFFYLQDSDLTNAEIITALEAEVVSKTAGASYKGLGEIVSKMGF